MTLSELRQACARAGIRVSAEQGQLRVKAPAGAATPEIRAALATRKQEFLALLAAPHKEFSPLSSSQRSLWLLHQADPETLPAYNLRAARRLRGRLHRDHFKAALRSLVARHDPLRTAFDYHEEESWQHVMPSVPVAITEHDLSARPPAEREAAWRALLAEEGRRLFDLTAAPLFTVHLLALAPDEHVLLLNAHHLIADAWSAGLLLREWAEIYAELVAGGTPSSDPPAYRFNEYVIDRRRAETGPAAERSLAHWLTHLAGLRPLTWPRAEPPPAAPSRYAGRSVDFVILPATEQPLRALARAEGATLFHVLVAAYAVWLQRLSGKDDFGLGTTLAGRDGMATESLVGYFVNLVVLRPPLADQPSFRELVRRMRRETLSAFEHQATPFDRIVQELRLPREAEASPLLQALFLYLQTARDEASFPGLRAEAISVPSETAKYALSLQVEDHGDRLTGIVEYRVGHFAPEMMARLLEVWATLLAELAGSPDRPITQAAALGGEARQAVLAQSCGTRRARVDEGGIAAAFQAQVARTPNAVALVYEDREFTYAELDGASEHVAQRLRSVGVGPECRVGVLLERGVELILTLLGVLKAGGAYVPMDPAYPADRLRHMVEDAQPLLVVTRRALEAMLPGGGPARLLVDDLALDAPGTIVPTTARAEQPAYVIYTSGSTGKPKGVVVTHGNATNFFVGMDAQLGREPGVWLALTSISFDISVLELFWTLSRGFKVVLQSDDVDLGVIQPRPQWSLADQFARHRPTHFQATPSRLKMLLLDPAIRPGLARLEVLIAGGEALPPPLARELRAELGGRLHNLYGPTETTVWSTGHALASSDDVILIGCPLVNQTAYVLDAGLQPVPNGVAGELYLGGDGVTRGYLGRPELTAERFLPDPFAAQPGVRMYRTGDLARWRGPGRLECLGRVDQQVKILGHRIEPGEIEAVLASHPDVGAAAVTSPRGPDGEPRLVAYFVPRRADAASALRPEALRAWLRERLPAYLVPAIYVSLGEMPQTPNGKIDRKVLPAPGAEAMPAGPGVAPRTLLEARVAALWRELLQRPQVGMDENFFEIGGHSLLAMQLIARLRAALGADLTLRAIFEGPTVAAMAARITLMAETEAASAPLPARDPGPWPLSLGQRRLWFIEQLEPGRSTYHVPGGLRLRGACVVAALEQSFTDLVRRHEALRTRFPVRDGEPFQDILSAKSIHFTLPRDDLRLLPRSEREERARALADETAVAAFDLATGPLIRARLIQLADEDHLLVVVIHHIVSDGWTINLITRELTACYGARVAGEEPSLPPLTAHYADFAEWQRRQHSATRLQKSLDFWRAHLVGGVAAEIPADRQRPRVVNGVGREYRCGWSAELTAGLHRLAQREGVTLYMVLVAGYAAVLARHARQDDLVLGTSVANRPRPEFEAMAGFFVNLLPVRVDLQGDPDFGTLLARVKQSCISGYAHQDAPFESLIDALAPVRELSRTPVFQTLFVLLNAPPASARLAGLEITPVPLANRTAKFDVTLLAEEVAGELRWIAEYRTELYHEDTLRRLLGHLRTLLSAAVARPGARLSELPLLAAEEVAAQSVWSRSERVFASGPWIHEQPRAITPTAPALVSSAGTLTYAEFNRRADALAACLQARGVGPESLVAVCLERSPELVLALHAVLRAGGAYVPLDPAYPAERLAFMLADAAPVLVLTTDALAARLGVAPERVLRVEETLFAAVEPGLRPPTLAGLGAAYMIYTSGSTGRPKGAVNTHAAILNRLQWMQAALPLTAADRVLQKTPYSFDVSVWEFFWPLMTGATLVVADPGVHQDPVRLIEVIVAERITTLHFVPSMLRAWLETPGVERCISVRQIVCSGEELPRDLLVMTHEKLPAVAVHNLYGPTEAAVDVSWHACRRGETGPVPIGGPIANVELHVLDEQLRPVPVGVPGEIYLGGVGLGRGYHGQPTLTAERWVPDPTPRVPGARLYRTGDLGRWRPEGEIEYLGRIDFQVKLRGQRIELGEIEAALRDQASVADAVCTLREDAPAGARIVAYVVARGAAPSSAGLRAWLTERLPDYMVPTAWVFLEALPLSPAGKVDRRALPAPRIERVLERVAPRDGDEQLVLAIWREVLARDDLGMSDDFFEVGGHSLVATRVMTRLRERAGVTLPLRVLFEHPTAEALAAALRTERARGTAPVLAGTLRRASRERRAVAIGADGEIAGEAAVAGGTR
jgi:amino acid adenylation domain-containing protein